MSDPTLSANAILLMHSHEDMGCDRRVRQLEVLTLMTMIESGEYAFTVGASTELATNVITGCGHYGQEVCGCEY